MDNHMSLSCNFFRVLISVSNQTYYFGMSKIFKAKNEDFVFVNPFESVKMELNVLIVESKYKHL